MTITTHTHTVRTRDQGDAHDVTALAASAVSASKIRSGLAVVFVVGSTAAITMIEFESGAIADFNALLDRLAPKDAEYRHHLRWGDDNGSSHVRAALLGPSLTVPVVDGALVLGTWQQIMLIECDTRGRDRQIVVQVMGQ